MARKNTKIIKCSCVSAQQDKEYGEGSRAHNSAASKTPSSRLWRCTVCGSEKTESASGGNG